MNLDHAAYETLRTERLSDTAAGVAPLTFAQVASWAVWAEPQGSGTGWVRDLEPLAWGRLEGVAHRRVVLVALNKGTNLAGPRPVRDADWSSFHSGRTDYRLARALSQGPARDQVWGAYLTDFFKGLPTPTAAALRDHLDGLGPTARVRVVDTMVQLLERELAIRGARNPVLVGIGADAHRWLQRSMAHHAVLGITHYAATIPMATYRAELAALARQVSRTPIR